MENEIDTVDYKGYTIHILYDNDPLDPCTEFDMMGKMCFFHDRYNLGHKHELDDDSPDGLIEFVTRKDVLALPVYMYEHGGITISTGRGYPYNDMWDSGMIGYIYVTYETLRKEYKVKHITKKTLEKATQLLKAEIDEYDDYLTGNVYGFVVTAQDDEDDLDSCWGFYGDDGRKEAINQGKGFIDWQEKEESQAVFLSQAYLTGLEV